MELAEFFTWVATLFDSASKAIIAAGTLVAALLAGVAYKARKEPPPAGTPDALIIALGELTQVTKGQTGNFAENMRHFQEVCEISAKLLDEIKEVRRAAEHSREHLSAIRDAVNRR